MTFDPPTIPNGNITRYIIYYTPLDDQERASQVGQVPSKPIREWMTYHMVGDKLNEGTKHVLVTDFVEPDTGYAVVIQAANPDGPGPYSVQHSIRKFFAHDLWAAFLPEIKLQARCRDRGKARPKNCW